MIFPFIENELDTNIWITIPEICDILNIEPKIICSRMNDLGLRKKIARGNRFIIIPTENAEKLKYVTYDKRNIYPTTRWHCQKTIAILTDGKQTDGLMLTLPYHLFEFNLDQWRHIFLSDYKSLFRDKISILRINHLLQSSLRVYFWSSADAAVAKLI